MIVFCIVGTEDETGGDGAGEVSTGVWRARVWCAGDGLLLLDDYYRTVGGPSIVFLRPTQARVGVASC